MKIFPHINVYSFDVFDTCVTRRFAHPHDVFYELGWSLAPQILEEEKKHRIAKEFQRRRIHAERMAHKLDAARESATIFDIYRHFTPPREISNDLRELVDLEIALESRNLYAVPQIKNFIGHLRQNKCRIIFISDMYLPAKILRPILMGMGVLLADDNLYVSCDVGLTKHSGNLFRHVIECEGIEPSRIIHIGDNYHADIKMARQAGMTANHFPDAMLSSHEGKIARNSNQRSRHDFLLAGLCRQSRLTFQLNDSSDTNAIDRILHSTIMPLLIAFVIWTLEDAKKRGIKRLYFVARDGQVLHEIASQLQNQAHNLDIRYLYGSRRAWLLPSISNDTRNWVRLLVTPGVSNSRSDILSRAGLTQDIQEQVRNAFAISQQAWRTPLDRREAIAFVESVLQHDTASLQLLDAAQEHRTLAIEYFAQEGLLDDEPWAIVDAGWALNCQAALKRILSNAKGKAFDPIGYYISLGDDRLAAEEAGIAYSWLPSSCTIFSNRRTVFEHCFTPATHPTTLGYQRNIDRIVPKFGKEYRTDAELAYAHRLRQAVVHWSSFITKESNLRSFLVEASAQIVRNAENFIAHPAPEDARTMGSFTICSDLRHEEESSRPLCSPIGFRDVLELILTTIHPMRSFKTPTMLWLEGSEALSSPHIRLLVRCMRRIASLAAHLKS